MKVVLCIKEMLKHVGGAERSLAELANALADRGHEIVILNREYRFEESGELFYPLHDKVKLITFYLDKKIENRVSEHHDPVSSRPFFMGWHNNQLIVKVFGFSLPVGLKPFSKLKKKFAGAEGQTAEGRENERYNKWLTANDAEISLWHRYLTRAKPDVVISFMHFVYIIVHQAIKKLNIPHIIANRNDPLNCPVLYNKPFFKKVIYEAVDHSVYNLIQNEAFRAYFLQGHQDKTVVIPNPVAIDGEAKREPVQRKKVILSVGSYRNQKNHGLLIRAFSSISHKYPDWSVKIFGEDLGLKDELHGFIHALGLDEQVTLYPPENDIHNEYRKAAIFAMPSLYEGFSRALGEAMAHGLPCLVIADCLSNREMVENGNCGLVATNEPDDYAEKLEMLMSDSDKRNKLGGHGKKHAGKFAPENIYDMWEKLLTGLPKTQTGHLRRSVHNVDTTSK